MQLRVAAIGLNQEESKAVQREEGRKEMTKRKRDLFFFFLRCPLKLDDHSHEAKELLQRNLRHVAADIVDLFEKEKREKKRSKERKERKKERILNKSRMNIE